MWQREEIKSVQKSRGLYYVLCSRLLTHLWKSVSGSYFNSVVIYLCSSNQVLDIVKNLGGYFYTHSVIMFSYHRQYCHKQQNVGTHWLKSFAYVDWLHCVSWFLLWSFNADWSRLQFISVHWYFYRQCTECLLLNICQCFDITLL